jgi:SWI/SNF-related matrix-associated actin-dependent regulator of chromatin subfamily A3
MFPHNLHLENINVDLDFYAAESSARNENIILLPEFAESQTSNKADDLLGRRKVYYVYDLKNDTQIYEVDFENAPVILKNRDVVQKYKEIKRYCPYEEHLTDFFDIYYQPGKVLYFTLKNISLITKSFLNENPLIKTIIDRDIKHSNYLINDRGFSYICNEFGKRRLEDYYNLVEQPAQIKTRLYDYQRDNLHWMTSREREPVDFFFTDHKISVLEDNRVYDYYIDDFVASDFSSFDKLRIRGGILMDDVGIGKTIQALSLIAQNPVATLVVVPVHLEKYWMDQIYTHIHDTESFLKHTKIVNFERAKIELSNYKYERLIVDEIHEIFSSMSLVEALSFYKCEYKWGLTATPWVHSNSLYLLFSFLTNHRFVYCNAVRIKQYYHIYNKVFRKYDKDTIQKEVFLPELHIYNVLIQFSELERNLYNIERSANDHCHVDFLRELCGCIDMNTDFYTSTVIMNHFETAYTKEKTTLDQYIKIIENLTICFNTKPNSEIENNLSYYKQLFEKQEKVVYSRLRAFERYKEGLEKIESIINSGHVEECLICCSEMIHKIAYYKCGHYFCHECILQLRKSNVKCPYCRNETRDDELYLLTKKKSQKYNSKINRLVELINSKDEKFIIYTQFPKVLNLLASVFTQEGKSFRIYNSFDTLTDRSSCNILLINNVTNASGIDLTDFNNIIIFEPFQDEYSFKQIEQQMIGRIYRIGQKKETNVYRLIIKNTIESELYCIE